MSDGAELASSTVLTYLYSYWLSTGHHVKPDIIGRMVTGRLLLTCCITPFVGTIERKVGSRVTVMIGCGLSTLGILLLYFCANSIAGCVVAFSVLHGAGSSVLYVLSVAIAGRWFPERSGTVAGIVLGGSTGGAICVVEILTLYINPENVKPHHCDGISVFLEGFIADRVPQALFALAMFVVITQIISLPFLESLDHAYENIDTEPSDKLCVSNC